MKNNSFKTTIIVLILMSFSVPVYSQGLRLKAISKSEPEIYFGKDKEFITHFFLHTAIATWRPEYSLIATISIETADTLNGRFDLNDWVARLSGCLTGYLIKKFILSKL